MINSHGVPARVARIWWNSSYHENFFSEKFHEIGKLRKRKDDGGGRYLFGD